MPSLVAKQIASYAQRSSLIRKMFETGLKLKAQYGAQAVCDFSLGNPDLPAPAAVARALEKVLREADRPGAFGYGPNAGMPAARERVAAHLAAEQGVPVTPQDVILTCGAAGAINALFRAVLDPGDEVLVPAPYFAEYAFYAENFNGVFKTVETGEDFSLDFDALDRAVTPKTKVLLINTPNNPTGRIYSQKELEALAELLERKRRECGHPVLLVSDEPYRALAYDGVCVPPLLPLYPWTVVLNSFSKTLSLPGERIGYAALAPQMPEKEDLMAALTMTNRILGFVNAPIIGQTIITTAIESRVDVAAYARRRDLMARVLRKTGYSFFMPEGGFYFFPKAPGGDDRAFIERLREELVLGVPGSGFGRAGYFRLAFCVSEDVIERSKEGFRKARAAFEA